MVSTCNNTLSETHWNTDSIVGNFTLHTLGWIICGVCAIIATIISLFLIIRHAAHYTVPNEQRHIIRILLMVPVYALTSWLSYVWYWHAIYWEVARDCYEAFAIVGFFALLCNYISPTLHNQKGFFSKLEVKPWPWPFGKVAKPHSGLTWFNIIWTGIFQYVTVRIACTITATVTEAMGVYCENSLSPKFANIWTTVANIIAVTVAMYFLITFHIGLKEVLVDKKPFFKLLCIKLVIFFSFWQMTILDILSATGAIKPTPYMSRGDISVGFNSLLICFEMIIFAFLHLFAFSWREYDRGPHKKTSIFAALLDAFNPWDIVLATARGARWILCGVSHRRTDAEKVLERQKAEEASRLVDNAAEFAGRESPLPGHDGGLATYHPAPSDTVLEVNTLKVQTGSYHPESVEMTITPPRPGRQRPHAPPLPHGQQVASSGYGHAIAAPPQGPHERHERYRDKTPSAVKKQSQLAYPTVNYMPSTLGQGALSDYLHSPTSPIVAGANSPMLPIVDEQTGGGQQQHQQQQQEDTAQKPT